MRLPLDDNTRGISGYHSVMNGCPLLALRKASHCLLKWQTKQFYRQSSLGSGEAS